MQLIYIPSIYNHKTHRGIVKFCLEHDIILFSPHIHDYEVNPDVMRSIDGVICHNIGSSTVAPILRKLNETIPIVDLSSETSYKGRHYQVTLDNELIGIRAADYLTSKGFKSLMFINSSTPLRLDAQHRILGASEFCSEHDVEFKSIPITEFEEAICSSELPVGLIAENDDTAIRTMHILKGVDIKVPLQASIIGVGNDALFCETAPTTLTSVDPDSEKRGYVAAQVIYDLILGKSVPRQTLIAPTGVVERASTNLLAINHQPTIKALKHIKDNIYDKGLTVDQVVDASGICRRRLEDAFIKYVRHSIPAEIRRLRIAEVKRMLKKTNLHINEISCKCGFGSPVSLNRIFKKEVGICPTKYRAH